MSRVVTLGGFSGPGGSVDALSFGGGFPVVVQTMWKDRLSLADLEGKTGEGILKRIRGLGEMGCGLLRFAAPDPEAAEALGRLASMVSMPLAADIHFDYRIALRCLDFPIAKIRINPGNIGGRDRVEKVLSKAAERGVPIRIGVNAGSLPQDLRRLAEAGEITGAEALVRAAERELALFREFNFSQFLVSMKASSIADTIRANRLLADRTDAPLHIGLTEAGPLIAGVARSSIALHTLLAEGIGATIRVSLSDTMENEIIAGREILGALADTAERPESRTGVRIVSCPRCGRNGFDTHGFTERWASRLYSLKKSITIAVMGCAVNGPGEARHADLGITGAGNRVLIFRHGRIVRTIDAAQADEVFEEELGKF
jgi:(E)-4-hydroxy-3-methylbut-2-enyl-diphosphate synthase